MGMVEQIANGLEKLEMILYVLFATALVFASAVAVSFFFIVDSFANSLLLGGGITVFIVVLAYILGTDGDE